MHDGPFFSSEQSLVQKWATPRVPGSQRLHTEDGRESSSLKLATFQRRVAESLPSDVTNESNLHNRERKTGEESDCTESDCTLEAVMFFPFVHIFSAGGGEITLPPSVVKNGVRVQSRRIKVRLGSVEPPSTATSTRPQVPCSVTVIVQLTSTVPQQCLSAFAHWCGFV